MKHFKKPDGSVFAFELDGSQDELITSDMVAMTAAELALHENPPPTLAQVQAQLSAAVQRHLDEVAQGRGYDNINSAVSYADEPEEPKYQAEGRAFRKWRSKVWRRCGEVLADVHDGKRAVPTAQELINLLPEVAL